MSENLENQDAVDTTGSSPVANPFDDESWVSPVNADDSNVISENAGSNGSQENNDYSRYSQSNEETESDEEIVDANEYLRNNLGFNDWDQAKTEIQKLRESSNVKYNNDISEKIHLALLEGKHDEVYSYLDNNRRLDSLLSHDIDDKKAEDIVKLSMRYQYPDLTEDEINFKYNKNFSLPKEPSQKYDETDEDFEQRKQDWESRVKDIKMELMIEAKSSRSQLNNLRAEIKLPEISNSYGTKLTQEELQYVQNYTNSYKGSVDSHMNSFEGFGIEYQDEDVSINSAYMPSEEERSSISNQLKYFADNDFNANMLLADRWVNDDGNINMNQVIQDLSILQYGDKIIQKLVNDSVSKRLYEYRKSTSNIKVGGQGSGTFTPNNDKSQFNQMAEFFFGQ